jgi:hypothetical protein
VSEQASDMTDATLLRRARSAAIRLHVALLLADENWRASLIQLLSSPVSDDVMSGREWLRAAAQFVPGAPVAQHLLGCLAVAAGTEHH